jgi:hypothetical protein
MGTMGICKLCGVSVGDKRSVCDSIEHGEGMSNMLELGRVCND